MRKFALVGAVPVMALQPGLSQRVRKALSQVDAESSKCQETVEHDCLIDESRNAMGANRCAANAECRGDRTCSVSGWCHGDAGCDGGHWAPSCVDDLSTADSSGDSCRAYNAHPEWCGRYDTADFNSGE